MRRQNASAYVRIYRDKCNILLICVLEPKKKFFLTRKKGFRPILGFAGWEAHLGFIKCILSRGKGQGAAGGRGQWTCSGHRSFCPCKMLKRSPQQVPMLCSWSSTTPSQLIVNAQTRQTGRRMVSQANLGHHDGKGTERKHYGQSSFETTWQLTDEHP